jgi:hypothetical protein
VLGDRFEVVQDRFANALFSEGLVERRRVGRGRRRNRPPLVKAVEEVRCEPIDALRDRPEFVGRDSQRRHRVEVSPTPPFATTHEPATPSRITPSFSSSPGCGCIAAADALSSGRAADAHAR